VYFKIINMSTANTVLMQQAEPVAEVETPVAEVEAPAADTTEPTAPTESVE
jgi:hypothetical protein